VTNPWIIGVTATLATLMELLDTAIPDRASLVSPSATRKALGS
jgi:hypothetical protein